MKNYLKYFSLSIGLWLLGLGAGVCLTNNINKISVDNDIALLREKRIEHKIFEALDGNNEIKAFILIASNNLKVAAINIVGGILFGIPIFIINAIQWIRLRLNIRSTLFCRIFH